ncbi:MAG: diaminobutyrate--2-oxoglutarate transaminase family protein [Solirubrobacterales bacterium]|nr:diaminobutyrate--2-oxoglutarate transaminase family protein [Solirubrobacterales bacterium]
MEASSNGLEKAPGVLQQASVRTPVPGPLSARLLERQVLNESNVRTYPRGLPIAIGRGAGSYLEDLDGNVFIDFLTGAGALPLGHTHPELVEAITRQLSRLTHGLDFPTEIRDEFISAQISMLPERMRSSMRIEFCGPSGADAVDAALKLCKTATGRSEIVTFQGAFHGCSHAAMTITGLVAAKERVAGRVPGVHFFPYPYPLRCALGGGEESGQRCLEYLERSLRDPLGGIPRPAAVIVEMVQGEGGVIPAPGDFVRGLRRVTRELEIPLIVDEVQTGGGRTGTWFAFEQHGIEPDVIVASKAIGGMGMPVAVVLHDERLDAFAPGAHTGTFRGNQLAFAAGVASARIIRRDGILEHAREQGAYALGVLEGFARDHEIVREARGSGLMLGFELVDPVTGEPNTQAASAVQRGAIERGLIVELGGRGDCVVRLLPPLNVSRETLDEGFEILDSVLAEIPLAVAHEAQLR